MSEPRAIPDEERPFIPEEGFPDREEQPAERASDDADDEEDEPDAFAGDAPDEG